MRGFFCLLGELCGDDLRGVGSGFSLPSDGQKGAAMRVAGERIKRTRLIQTDRYVVAVEVEMVVPPDDPGEPCYEAQTVQLLRHVREAAERGDEEWLRRQAKVYVVADVA